MDPARPLHQRFGLTPVINARGTFTPLGVSRSSAPVRNVVAAALGEFFVIDELQALLSTEVARITGAEAAVLTHCASAGITLGIAAAMTGGDSTRIAALPDARGMPRRVVLPAGHAIDYGHPIVTDIRLAGGLPVLAGERSGCTIAQLAAALAHDDTACLLLVSSRLVSDPALDLTAAVDAAHRRGVPALIDGAAQDLRIGALLATGADAVVLSAHKYLASPTAGLVMGRERWISAVRAQERGIGRAMKTSKEALLGVLAALEERERLDVSAWSAAQDRKAAWFVEQVGALAGLSATAVPDPAGMPFPRVCLKVEPLEPLAEGWSARSLADALRAGSPSIWVMDHAALQGQLWLELVPLTETEMQVIIERLHAVVAQVGEGGRTAH